MPGAYQILFLDPNNLEKLTIFSADTSEQLDCCSFDPATSALFVASTKMSLDVSTGSKQEEVTIKRSYLTMLEVVVKISKLSTTPSTDYHLEKKDQVKTLEQIAMICVSETGTKVVTVAQRNGASQGRSFLVEWSIQPKPTTSSAVHCLVKRQRMACTGLVTSVAVSQDSSWLFVGKEDGTLQIWCIDPSIPCEHILGRDPFIAKEKLHGSSGKCIRSVNVKRHEGSIAGDLEVFVTDQSATVVQWRFNCTEGMIMGAGVHLSMHIVGHFRTSQHQNFCTTLSIAINRDAAKANLLLLVQSNVVSIVGILDSQDVLWRTPKESILGVCSAANMTRSPVFASIGTEKNSHVRMLLPRKENLSLIDFGMYAFTDITLHEDQTSAPVSALSCFQVNGEKELWVALGRSNGTCDFYLVCNERFTKMAWLFPRHTDTAVSTIMFDETENEILLKNRKKVHDSKSAIQNRGFLCVGYTDGHIGVWQLPSVLLCKALVPQYLQKAHSTSLIHLECIRDHNKFHWYSKLVTISTDGLLKIWNFPAMVISQTISTKIGELTLTCTMKLIAGYEHTPKVAVIGNENGTLSVWSLDDSTHFQVSHKHERRISSIASISNSHGREFATASWDSSIITWEIVMNFVRLKRQILVDGPIIGLACNCSYFIIAYSHDICGLGYERDIKQFFIEEKKESVQIVSNAISIAQDHPPQKEPSISEANDKVSETKDFRMYLNQFIAINGLKNTILAEELCDFVTGCPTFLMAEKSMRRLKFDLRKFLHARRLRPTERLNEDTCVNTLDAFLWREFASVAKKKKCSVKSKPLITRYNEFGEKVIIRQVEKSASDKCTSEIFTVRANTHANSAVESEEYELEMPKAGSMKIVSISNQFRKHWNGGYCWCGDRGAIFLERNEQARKRCLRCGNKLNTYDFENEDRPIHFSSTFLDRLSLVIVSIMAEQSLAIISWKHQSVEDRYRSIHDNLFQLFEKKYGLRDMLLHKIRLLIISIALQSTHSDIAFVLAAFFGIFVDNVGYEAPKELLAFCISTEAWLISRDAIINRSQGHEIHRYVLVSVALACIKDISEYSILSPRLLSDILAAISGPMDHHLDLNRMLKVIIQVWQQDVLDLKSARYALFGVYETTESISSAPRPLHASTNLDKLQFLLTCFLFHDPHRSGAVPEHIFKEIWEKLRQFWVVDPLHFDVQEESSQVALRAIIMRFRDIEHDGAISYIDFWAMLYLTRNKRTAEMLSLHQMTLFSKIYKLGIPFETQDAILTFMQRVRDSNLPKYNHNVDYDVTLLHSVDHTSSTSFQQGTFHFKKSMHSSMSTEMLLNQRTENITDGLYVDGEHPILRLCKSTSTPILSSKNLSAQESTQSRFYIKRDNDSGGKTDRGLAKIHQQELALTIQDKTHRQTTLPQVEMTASSVILSTIPSPSIFKKGYFLEAVGKSPKHRKPLNVIDHKEDFNLLHGTTPRSSQQHETNKKAMARALSDARSRVRQARGLSAPQQKRLLKTKLRLRSLDRVSTLEEDSSSITTARTARPLSGLSPQTEAILIDTQSALGRGTDGEYEWSTVNDGGDLSESQASEDMADLESREEISAGDIPESELQLVSADDTVTSFEGKPQSITKDEILAEEVGKRSDDQMITKDEIDDPQRRFLGMHFRFSQQPEFDTSSLLNLSARALGWNPADLSDESECDDASEDEDKAENDSNGLEKESSFFSGRTPASSLMPQLAKNRLRLDDATEGALYREKVSHPLAQEVVLSKDLEAAMRKNWSDIFEANEKLLFHGFRSSANCLADKSLSEAPRKRQPSIQPDIQNLAIGEESHGKLYNPGSCALYQHEMSREEILQVDAQGSPLMTARLRILEGSADMFMATDVINPSCEHHQWKSVKAEREGYVFGNANTRIILLHAQELADILSELSTATSIIFYISATALKADTRYSISVTRPVSDRVISVCKEIPTNSTAEASFQIDEPTNRSMERMYCNACHKVREEYDSSLITDTHGSCLIDEVDVTEGYITGHSFDRDPNLPLRQLSSDSYEIKGIHLEEKASHTCNDQMKHLQSALLDTNMPQRSIQKLVPVQKPSTLSRRKMMRYMPKPIAYSLSKLDQ
uniref:Uncharacterized protein AlNc14C51G4016 n=1 Tax=Albugo laibachii Nc14 TaxID=890382 RepID=F0WBG9_9STRA|nr:conserved hypothetical protein [Albugo laibachii Nc14]|eukprot:CCA18495.1 conserved hypothetical protein [Albugo laibachii Nc14]